MKTRLILILITFFTTLLFVSAKFFEQTEKNYVAFDQNLYTGRYEITNQEYNIFLTDLKTKGLNELYSICIYDSTQWSKINPTVNPSPFQAYYHTHPAYREHPVVNITLEGAKSYCVWLTDKYHQNPKRKYQKVVFRLPTEKEWIALAKPLPGHNLPWEGNVGYIKHKNRSELQALANINLNLHPNDSIINFPHLVGFFKPNKIGVYDVIGNVAELTAEGKIKGGSCNNTIDECTTGKTQSFTLSSPYVGFRVVMEIIEN